jgi:hypothetical protein
VLKFFTIMHNLVSNGEQPTRPQASTLNSHERLFLAEVLSNVRLVQHDHIVRVRLPAVLRIPIATLSQLCCYLKFPSRPNGLWHWLELLDGPLKHMDKKLEGISFIPRALSFSSKRLWKSYSSPKHGQSACTKVKL